MLANRPGQRMLAVLTLGIGLGMAQVGQAGPISDMLARHRAQRQVKLGPVEKPFTNKPFRDLSTPPSVTDRLKKRFAIRKQVGTTGQSHLPSIFARKDKDPGVIKTSR